MSAARENLGAWMREHVSEDLRPALSKLVAAFVAEAVRADRQRRAEENAAKDRAREAVKKVNAMADPSGLRALTESLFGGKGR